MSYPVQVSNISPVTTESHLHDFFTFCGKIGKIDYNASAKEATIYFEKISAAKTALMLNGGTLDGSSLSVSSTAVSEHDPAPHEPEASGSGEHHHIAQEDKPKAGIVAEYLAKGYTLGDPILQKAIDLDQKNGISSRFLTYIKSLDHTLGSKIAGPEATLSGAAVTRGKTIDEKYGITTRANTYYEKAFTSPWGKKVFEFYSTTSKQVLDIHEEAKRIAETHKAAGTTPAAPVPVTTTPAAPATTVV